MTVETEDYSWTINDSDLHVSIRVDDSTIVSVTIPIEAIENEIRMKTVLVEEGR
jgi:hypothetical protein